MLTREREYRNLEKTNHKGLNQTKDQQIQIRIQRAPKLSKNFNYHRQQNHIFMKKNGRQRKNTKQPTFKPEQRSANIQQRTIS